MPKAWLDKVTIESVEVEIPEACPGCGEDVFSPDAEVAVDSLDVYLYRGVRLSVDPTGRAWFGWDDADYDHGGETFNTGVVCSCGHILASAVGAECWAACGCRKEARDGQATG